MIVATCHCGVVKIEVSSIPESLTRCTCSICHRVGALWAYCDSATATVYCEPEALTLYQWNDKVIEFNHCNTCGCLTHYESTDNSGDYRIAVNARMINPAEIEKVKIKVFDGADTWEYIDD